MMRRRRDQFYAWGGSPYRRDVFADLVARYLAAFARLCSLRHLDLEVFGVHHVFGGDAKSARSDLFDRRIAGIGDIERHVARIVFTTLAGVASCSDTVHRNSKRFVCLAGY